MESLPPLPVLQAFEAAARLGNFSRAARERHLTAGAISRHIQTLEHWCGEKLFTRNGPHIALSDAGKTLHARLSEPLQALRDALTAPGEAASQLNIFTLPSIAVSWLLPQFAEFRALYPRIRLSILTHYAIASLPPGLPAVALRFGHFDHSGLSTWRSGDEQMVAVASPGWQAAHPDPACWPSADMLRHTDSPWPKRLKLREAEGPEFNDAALVLEAARQGLGVAWVRERMVTNDLVRFDLSLTADRHYWLTCRSELSGHPAVTAFRDWWLPKMG